jgi:hypothetical protein
VPTIYLEYACEIFRHGRYLSITTHHYMVAIMELSALMLKCGKVDYIGLPCMRMPNLSFDDASDVRSTRTLMQGIRCY